MSAKCKAQSAKRRYLPFYFLLLTAYCLLGCSVPNLEKPECTDARNAMREFYSFDYSNDTKFNQENLKLRQKFLTPELFQMLAQKPDSVTDYFTASDEPPKAFRIGSCQVVEPAKKTSLSVVFFWKDGEVSRQKEVQVEADKINSEWLVNKVEAK